MKKIFTRLFSFLDRKGYEPDQSDIPVFDDTMTSEMPQTTASKDVSTTSSGIAEEFKKAKAEIDEFEKAIKELSKHQV